MQVGGAYLALYLWGFMLALSLFFMTIYPTVIAPLFNKFETLPEVGMGPCTSPPPPFLCRYGFGKNKRIVLYDTLLAHCSEEQVVAVLAHELGG